MSTLQTIINLLAYACFGLGSLIVWPSRRNAVAWMAFAFFVTAYLIPLLVIDYASDFSPETLWRFTALNGVGAVGMLAGLWAGKLRNGRRHAVQTSRPALMASALEPRILVTLLVANIALTLCFAWMGGPPILAEDPFLAKFFRGDYKTKYDQVSIMYRFAQAIQVTAMPVGVAILTYTRSTKLGLLLLWTMLLFAGALTRGFVLNGLLLVIAVWATKTRQRWAFFVLGTTLLIGFGSSIFAILGLLGERDASIWQDIAVGAPDIFDQLSLFSNFRFTEHLTYGLSFVGGLIPGNFYYNPSVLSLLIANDVTDITDLPSGGFRLSPPLYGFVAFYWVGALVVPTLSGYLLSKAVLNLRHAWSRDLLGNVIATQWFLVVSNVVVGFYVMTYSAALSALIFMWILRPAPVQWRTPLGPLWWNKFTLGRPLRIRNATSSASVIAPSHE